MYYQQSLPILMMGGGDDDDDEGEEEEEEEEEEMMMVMAIWQLWLRVSHTAVEIGACKGNYMAHKSTDVITYPSHGIC